MLRHYPAIFMTDATIALILFTNATGLAFWLKPFITSIKLHYLKKLFHWFWSKFTALFVSFAFINNLDFCFLRLHNHLNESLGSYKLVGLLLWSSQLFFKRDQETCMFKYLCFFSVVLFQSLDSIQIWTIRKLVTDKFQTFILMKIFEW